MENILNTINQKMSFVLSAVTGTKEHLTNDDLENIKDENQVLDEAIENEQEVLLQETDNVYTSCDDILINSICMKIVNNTLINIGFFNNCDSSTLDEILDGNYITNDDVEVILEHKEHIINFIETNYKDEEFHNDLLIKVQELTNVDTK